jgi:tellurite resistance protein TehA-like permease
MGTGIVAVAARQLGHRLVAWPLFVIALLAYAVLGIILLARLVRFPRAVLADFVSHERGPNFLTIVAATGVVGTQFDVFGTLAGLLPSLFWFSLGLWCVLVYGFLGVVTVSSYKPGLEQGLNGAWLLLVVATESLAVLSGVLALQSGAPPSLAFAALAFYMLGVMLYVLLTTLILLRWIFRPMRAAQIDASWWINMGAVAIATLAGTQLMSLRGVAWDFGPLVSFVAPFTTLLWATSTFWIPLLVIVFIWKELRRGRRGYDPRDWSAVFPLGMYVVATHSFATAAGLPFLEWIPRTLFWFALLAWILTFVGMWVHLLRTRVVRPPLVNPPR